MLNLQRRNRLASAESRNHYLITEQLWLTENKCSGIAFWFLLSSNNCPLIFSHPLSIPSYQSLPCPISLHLTRCSSLNCALSHFFSLSSNQSPSVSAFFNQKLFHHISSVGKYNVTNRVTHKQANIIRQIKSACTGMMHLAKHSLQTELKELHCLDCENRAPRDTQTII